MLPCGRTAAGGGQLLGALGAVRAGSSGRAAAVEPLPARPPPMLKSVRPDACTSVDARIWPSASSPGLAPALRSPKDWPAIRAGSTNMIVQKLVARSSLAPRIAPAPVCRLQSSCSSSQSISSRHHALLTTYFAPLLGINIRAAAKAPSACHDPLPRARQRFSALPSPAILPLQAAEAPTLQ